MSKRFTKVHPAIWRSQRFMGLASNDAKLLHLYFLTSEHQNSAGAYVIPDGYVAADLSVNGLAAAGANLTTDSFVGGLESIKGYKDMFNGPAVTFGPNIRQGASSSFLAVAKGGRWTRVTEPLGF